MKLLNFDEVEKRRKRESLKQHREVILNASVPDVVRREVSFLESTLILMSRRSMGDLKWFVDKTLKEIASFKMHDKTRQDVARCVQTIITQLNR